jgi:hypothetical protein
MRGEAAAAPIDRIRSHLVGLRMPRALETLDHVMQQLERGQLGAIEAVEALLAEEITIRESRRVKAALQMARLAYTDRTIVPRSRKFGFNCGTSIAQ